MTDKGDERDFAHKGAVVSPNVEIAALQTNLEMARALLLASQIEINGLRAENDRLKQKLTYVELAFLLRVTFNVDTPYQIDTNIAQSLRTAVNQLIARRSATL